jgi:hypothetical protein
MSPQYAFWNSVVPIYPDRHRYTLELIGMVLRLAKYAEMQFKNALCVRRPDEYSPQIQPILQTPPHGSMPSGHSTEAHAVARVLSRLILNAAGTTVASRLRLHQQLMRQAARIAINRTVAGLHYPVDSMAGQALGLAVGDYFVARAKGGGMVDFWTFDGTAYPGDQDFTGGEIYDVAQDDRIFPVAGYLAKGNAQFSVDAAPKLKWLWDLAAREWA